MNPFLHVCRSYVMFSMYWCDNISQAMTYKEDFESERKDREAVHTKIAEMETRYRHQLEAIGEELRRVTDEARRHRETVATKEDELHTQSQLMTAQLHQKEAELASAGQQIQTLEVSIYVVIGKHAPT